MASGGGIVPGRCQFGRGAHTIAGGWEELVNKLIDLTLPLGPEVPVYPGDPVPEVRELSALSKGEAVTVSALEMGVHTGTHVDLPAHFIDDGKTLGDYPVESFVGPACVLDLTDVRRSIDGKRLAREAIPEDRHLLLKTRNSAFVRKPQFYRDYVFLESEAATYLLERKPRSIGLDYYSLDPVDSSTFPAHRLCAEQDLPVFVCLDLTAATPGYYYFAGLPLNVPSLEGAPVRAVLWEG